MISQMNKIYANAFFTIIAAAGEDAQTGLPGVTNLHRGTQREVCVRDVTLLEIPNSYADVYSSTWASRGWTFQECFLSTRRLIFTANEVLFLCNRTCAREGLKVPAGINDHVNGFKSIIPRLYGKGRNFSPDSLGNHIQNYSRRNLSYDSDSLNAILGVLNHYQHHSMSLTTRIAHLSWGLTADQHSKRPHIWNVHLLWYSKSPSLRRVAFPSWSWTGWTGAVGFPKEQMSIRLESGLEAKGKHALSALDWRVCFEMGGHKKEDITCFASDIMEQTRKGKELTNQLCPRQMSISCLVLHGYSAHGIELSQRAKCEGAKELSPHLKPRLIRLSRRDSRESHCNGVVVLQMWPGGYVCVGAYYDLLLKEKEPLLGLLVGDREVHHGQPNSLRCLLVRLRGDGCYERVGLTGNLSSHDGHGAGNFLDTKGGWVVRPKVDLDAAERRTIRLV